MRKAQANSLLLAVAFGASFASTSCRSTISDLKLHTTGLLVSALSIYESLPLTRPSVNLDGLPASIDLSSDFPSPGDQGQQNSCAAWAVGYGLKSYQAYMDKSWSLADGCYMEDALHLLLVKGDCSLATMPYNSSDSSTQPSRQAFSEAKLYRISSWSRTSRDSVADIRGFLANNQPVLIGIEAFPEFDALDASNPIYDSASGSSRGDRAMILIGHDDSKRAPKFMNCWGSEWGLNGYGWIAYDLVPYVVVVGYVATDVAQ
jgi:hypothetical protein